MNLLLFAAAVLFVVQATKTLIYYKPEWFGKVF